MNVASLSASTKGDSVMKACRIHRFGSPEVITLEDMDKPEPGEGGSSHPDQGRRIAALSTNQRPTAIIGCPHMTRPCRSMILLYKRWGVPPRAVADALYRAAGFADDELAGFRRGMAAAWLLSKTAQLRREPAGRVDKSHYFGPVTVAWVVSDCADESIYRHLRQGVLCPLPRPAAP
jgi:hypothetical protein